MIYIVLLLVVAVATLAGMCFFYRRKWTQERDRKWDEISESVNWMNSFQDVCEMREIEKEIYLDNICRFNETMMKKQSELSDLLCPLESHLWDYAGFGTRRCRRCGAVKHICGEPGVTEEYE